jgi:hypothetical protein
MTLRAVLALAWSLVMGLAGGWLVLSPWAVGQQPGSGDWTPVTTAQVRTGAALLVLAVIGLVLAILEGVSVLRASGVLAPRAPAPQRVEGPTGPGAQPESSNGELDRALISLATTLAADLDRSPRPAASEAARGADARAEGRPDRRSD